jgi:hypothetical protein
MRSACKLFAATLGATFLYGAVFAIVQLLPSIYRALWAPRVLGLRATAPGVWVVYIVCALITLALFATVISRQEAVRKGTRATPGGGLSRLLRLALLTLAAGVVLVSLGEFLLPGVQSQVGMIRIVTTILAIAVIYWAVAAAFAWLGVVLLNQRPFEAVVRSVGLVRSNWWGSFVVLLLALVVFIACVAAGAAAAYLWPFLASGELLGMTVAAVVVAVVINGLGMPFAAALLTARFADLRGRQPELDRA